MPDYLIVIAGPTAAGKTALAVELALRLKTEIISCDSKQFYREMTVGTAKPTPVQLAAVKHHFIDSLSVADDYSAGQYEADALKLLEKLFKKYNTLIMVGGSGLFIRAVCDGFDTFPPIEKHFREELNVLYQQKGIRYLQKLLLEKDSEYSRIVDMNNPQRLIRALEVTLATGIPYSSFRKRKKAQRSFTTIKTALMPEREKLYKWIDDRVDRMMETGLAEEALKLLPYKTRPALIATGYPEMFSFLEGKITLHHAVELIKRNTRRYAKRQLTWFRKEHDIRWFHPDDRNTIYNYIGERIGEKIT